jgi:hypothetical protein
VKKEKNNSEKIAVYVCVVGGWWEKKIKGRKGDIKGPNGNHK